jgi:hypothetical protein
LDVTSAEESNAAYPTTAIRIKPTQTKLSDDPAVVKQLLENQKNITELYQELSYAELKSVLENWLNPGSATSDDEVVEVLEAPKPKTAPKQSQTSTDMGGTQELNDLPWEKEAPAKKADDVASAFDDLFNN